MISKRRADGSIKRVRIHELLHVICKREAAKQINFLREFDDEEEQVSSNSTTAYGRRLSLHSSALRCISKITTKSASSEHVHSFLTFSSESIEIPKTLLSTIPNAFPNLKVLDMRPLVFPQLPKDLYRLQHLTYLWIKVIDLKVLPKEFGSLTQLHTLVLYTTTSQTCLKIEADIWSMPKLRHVLTKTYLQLPSPRIGRSAGNLTTLSTISPTSCTGEILDKTPNLQKLGIQGNLLVDVDDDLSRESKSSSTGIIISLFNNLQKLKYLEDLKLLHDSDLQAEARILQRFPEANKFPQRLRKLSLRKTSFKWKDLHVLGALNELEVLKLDENAFMGESWELSSNVVVFRCLRFLRIGRTDLANWRTSNTCFPVLTTLFITHCHKLKALPSDFAHLEPLQLLSLLHTTKQAANWAREIGMLKHENGNAAKSSRGFKLFIYPPDH